MSLGCHCLRIRSTSRFSDKKQGIRSILGLTMVEDIHCGMSLEQVVLCILNASQQQFMDDEDMALKAATIASSLENCWQKIGRLTPQKIEDYLAQVKKQAPSNRPSQQTFIEMIVSFSKSDDVITPSGLSSDDAF